MKELLDLLGRCEAYGVRPKRVRVTEDQLRTIYDAMPPDFDRPIPWSMMVRLARGETVGWWCGIYIAGVRLALAPHK